MKTRCTFIFSFLFIIGLSAQVSVGIHGSYGSAWQNYGDDFDQNGNPLKVRAYQLNATVYFQVSPFIAIGAEPGFSRRGTACRPGFTADNIFLPIADASLYADYIQLPVLLQMNYPIYKGRLVISAKLGAGPSFMTSAYNEIIVVGNNLPIAPTIMELPVDFKTDTDTNRWDFGAYTGLGIAVPLGPGNILLEGNYYYGFLNSSQSITSLNRSLQIGLGYRISF